MRNENNTITEYAFPPLIRAAIAVILAALWFGCGYIVGRDSVPVVDYSQPAQVHILPPKTQ